MKLNTKALFTIGIVTILMAGSLPVNADGQSPETIGKFVRLGMANDLTDDSVSETPSGIEIDAPAFSSSLKVDLAWIEDRVGAFSTSGEFHIDGQGRVVVPGQDTEFRKLEITAQPVFTLGSTGSIRFLERPMWLRIEHLENHGVKLEMNDGNSNGQGLFLAREWLWAQGIHWPEVVHEDGSLLAVEPTPDKLGFIVNVHHFSNVTINPEGLDVYGRQNGVLFPHLGERRWYYEDRYLTIAVGPSALAYELLVEKDWILANISANPIATPSPTNATVEGQPFYSFILQPSSFPRDVVFEAITVEPVLPFVGSIVAVAVADVTFGRSGAGGTCPFNVPSTLPAKYLGWKSSQFTGVDSDSHYDRQAHACYGETSDGVTSWAFIFWKLNKNNHGGNHLSHGGPSLACDETVWGASYCIRLLNRGDPAVTAFNAQTPAGGQTDECEIHHFDLSWGGFGVGWDASVCWADTWVHVASSQAAAWETRLWQGTSQIHSTYGFDFGVTQTVPMAGGTFNGEIALEAMTRFHCWYQWSGQTCITGNEEWYLDSTMLSEGDAFQAGPVVLGDRPYDHGQASAVISANDSDPAVALGTALLGAKLLLAAGDVFPVEALAAIADADALLSGYDERLPWTSTEIDAEVADLMNQTRSQLSQFVTQHRE